MKDLVDIVMYTTICVIDVTELQRRLHRELGVRKLDTPEGFDVPPEWRGAYERVYANMSAVKLLGEKRA